MPSAGLTSRTQHSACQKVYCARLFSCAYENKRRDFCEEKTEEKIEMQAAGRRATARHRRPFAEIRLQICREGRRVAGPNFRDGDTPSLPISVSILPCCRIYFGNRTSH